MLSVSLLEDLNTDSPSSAASPVIVAGGIGYFTAVTNATGREIWRTDGTEQGTTLVTELAPGSATLNPVPLQSLGNRALMVAGTNTNKLNQLWITDGTPEGTSQLATLPGKVYSSTSTATTAFMVVQGSSIIELWKTDGSAAGTKKLTNLPSSTTTLMPMGNYVYFANTDSIAGTELWRSDGTTTSRLVDIRVGSSSSFPDQITAVGNTLYFLANDGTAGNELWQSNGSPNNASMVANLEPGSASAAITHITAGTHLVYFSLHNEIWRSDGTGNGTFAISNVAPSSPVVNSISTDGDVVYFSLFAKNTSTQQVWCGSGVAGSPKIVWSTGSDGSLSNSPFVSRGIGGHVYFIGPPSSALCVSDGTAAGTKILSSTLVPFSNVSFFGTLNTLLADLNGIVLFPTKGISFGVELYRTDGTVSGTGRVKDIDDLPTRSSDPFDMTTVGNRVFFWAQTRDVSTSESALRLFVTDGTASGTHQLVQNHTPVNPIVSKSSIVAWKGRVYFACDDGSGNGNELWTSDGTVLGTHIVADISPGSASTTISMIYGASSFLYFDATTATYGEELWRSDGTANDAHLVKDIAPGTANGTLYSLLLIPLIIEYHNLIFFYAGDTATSLRLYRTDGTDSGTFQLTDFGVSSFFVAGDNLFFGSPLNHPEAELWTTDGTIAGTHRVKDIFPGITSSEPGNLTEFRGQLFFVATSPEAGRELWISDGTESGTHLFKDITSGSAGSSPSELTVVGDELLFNADDGIHGREWWKTDGTPAGTTMIADINPGADGSFSTIHDFVPQAINGVLVFVAYTPGAMDQFWRTDGTPDGTYPITAFPSNFGFNTFYGQYLGQSQGCLYYVFSGAQYGYEIWRFNGTTSGTGPLADIQPGPASSSPNRFVSFGTSALFTADTPNLGIEPWIIQDDTPPVVLVARMDPEISPLNLTLRFNEPLALNLSPGAVTITNIDTNQPIPADDLNIAYQPASGTIVVSGSTQNSQAIANGNYRVRIAAGAVTDTADNSLASDFTYDFFILNGDANRDRTVGFADLVSVAQHYGTPSGAKLTEGDFNYDGKVDFADLVIVAQNYGTSLPAPVVLPAAAALPIASPSDLLDKRQSSSKPLFSTVTIGKHPAPTPPVRPSR